MTNKMSEEVCQDCKEFNKFCSFECLGKSKLNNITEPVDLEKGEASEVERALEELKMNLVIDALKNGIKQMKDFNSKLDEKYPMSKYVDPVSIFRDASSISEKEQETCGIIPGTDILWKKNSSKFIKMEDLLGIIEQMHKDIEELKRK